MTVGSTRMTMSMIDGLRAALYTLLIVLYGTLANLLFVIIGVLISPLAPNLGYELISQIAYGLWSSLQYLFEELHHSKITFSGDDLPLGKESALIIANHLSYGDFFMIQAVAWRQQMLPYCRYFVKHSLIWTLPVYGLALYLSGMIMVKRNWVSDQKLAKEAFSNIKKRKAPVWLISYLEGTRFTERKRLQSQAFGRQRDLPMLEHVLLPRTKGFVAAVTELRNSHVEYLYDFTLVYGGPRGFQEAPSFLEILGTTRLSTKYAFHVHVRRYKLASLPTDNGELTDWALLRWKEKDQFLKDKQALWTAKGVLQ